MAITVGTPISSTVTLAFDGSNNSALISFTTVTGNDMLVVSITGANQGATSITFNNVALTQRRYTDDGNTGQASLWDLASPAIGTYNIKIVAVGTYTFGVGAVALSGVDVSGTPRGTGVTATGFSTTATASVTTVTNDVCIGVASTVAVATHDAGQTTLIDDYLAGGEYQQLDYKTASGTSTALTWTLASQRWAVAVQPYKPAPDPSGLTITSVNTTNTAFSTQIDSAVIGTGLSASVVCTYAGIACTNESASSSTSLKITFPNFFTNNIKLGRNYEFKVVG
jgi:hypothetical protein